MIKRLGEKHTTRNSVSLTNKIKGFKQSLRLNN